MNRKFFAIFTGVFMLISVNIQAQSMVDFNRDMSVRSRMIDQNLTKGKKTKGKTTGNKTVSMNSAKKSVNSSSAKSKTYFSYISIKIDNGVHASETSNLVLNLTYTDLKSGKVFVRKYAYDNRDDWFAVNDIAPGKYKLSAELIIQGKAVKTLIGSNNYWTKTVSAPYADSMEIEVVLFNDGGVESVKSEPGDLKVQVMR